MHYVALTHIRVLSFTLPFNTFCFFSSIYQRENSFSIWSVTWCAYVRVRVCFQFLMLKRLNSFMNHMKSINDCNDARHLPHQMKIQTWCKTFCVIIKFPIPNVKPTSTRTYKEIMDFSCCHRSGKIRLNIFVEL